MYMLKKDRVKIGYNMYMELGAVSMLPLPIFPFMDISAAMVNSITFNRRFMMGICF